MPRLILPAFGGVWSAILKIHWNLQMPPGISLGVGWRKNHPDYVERVAAQVERQAALKFSPAVITSRFFPRCRMRTKIRTNSENFRNTSAGASRSNRAACELAERVWEPSLAKTLADQRESNTRCWMTRTFLTTGLTLDDLAR